MSEHSSNAIAGQALREEIVEILRREAGSLEDTIATSILRAVTEKIGASAFAATDAERVWLELEKRCGSVHAHGSDEFTLFVRWDDLWAVMQPTPKKEQA